MLAAIFLSTLVASVPPAAPSNGLHLQPVTLLTAPGFWDLGFAYERVLLPTVSLGGAMHVGWGEKRPRPDDPLDAHAFGLQLLPTLYLQRTAPEGLYVAPGFAINHYWLEGQGGARDWTGYAGSMVVGWSFVHGPLNAKLGVGAAYQHRQIAVSETTEEHTGFAPTLDARLGFVF